VPSVLDLLDRLRPVVAPGADTASAVPADRRHEAESELAEVFAVIEDYREEADGIRTAARAKADQLLGDAAKHAEHIVEAAQRQADAARAEAAAAVHSDAEADLTAITAGAARRASELRHRANELLPSVVDEVVTESMSLVGL
jgi:cell division septum initiation protein DivIVA